MSAEQQWKDPATAIFRGFLGGREFKVHAHAWIGYHATQSTILTTLASGGVSVERSPGTYASPIKATQQR